jgi:hypothetical protein
VNQEQKKLKNTFSSVSYTSYKPWGDNNGIQQGRQRNIGWVEIDGVRNSLEIDEWWALHAGYAYWGLEKARAAVGCGGAKTIKQKARILPGFGNNGSISL